MIPDIVIECRYDGYYCGHCSKWHPAICTTECPICGEIGPHEHCEEECVYATVAIIEVDENDS
jgi:hypothetical protein